MGQSNYAIEVQGLNKSFPGAFYERPKQVLHDVSFRVREGVTTGFIGVNGSGKTTSLKCILGFIHSQGQLKVFGRSIRDENIRRRIGYLPERPYLYEFLTAREFLQFHWNLTGGGSGFDEACENILKRVNLESAVDRRIRTFSKGMMQRIGFAQALLRKPDLLILDEPTSGLDPDGRFLMKEIIKEEKKQARTIFFSSHFLGDVEELCEDLVVIDEGRILYQGPTISILQDKPTRIRLVYQTSGTAETGAGPTEIICEQQELESQLHRLNRDGAKVLAVSNEYIALEAAFKGLRGNKDSGS